MNQLRFTFCDTAPGATCEFQLHKKVKGRWKDVACGEVADWCIHIVRGDSRLEINLCRFCLARVTKEFVSMLSYLD